MPGIEGPEEIVGTATLPLGTFVACLAASRPAPGGGAAAAVAQALGHALIAMATGLSARKATGAEATALAAVAANETPAAQASLCFADRDAAAYAGYSHALALPRATVDQVNERRSAVRAAAGEAVAFGREAAEDAVSALAEAASVAARVRPAIVEDIAAAVALLQAALEIHLANLQANAQALPQAQAASVRAFADAQRARATEYGEVARQAIGEVLSRRGGV